MMNKREYILIIFLVLAIIAIVVAAIYFNNENREITATNNASNTVTQTPIQTTNIDPYSKYEGFTWARETSAGYATQKFEIVDAKLYLISNNAKTLVTSVIGVPKYVNAIIRGGVLSDIIVITEDGIVWKNTDVDDGITIAIKDAFTKVPLNGTVIDMTLGNEGVVPYSGPYYLTKEGKLIREDGKTYEQINGQHINMIGTFDCFVYINKDKTASYKRTEDTEDFIIDQIGKKVTLKQTFSESSERFSGTTQDHFYIVTEDNKLFDFSATSLMVANPYCDAKNRTVESLKMVSVSKIKINFTDGTNLIIAGIYSYYDMSTNKLINFEK